ncbi:MAG: PAS domain-containing sensor histidine kinase [Janthinobacterium lividum]
MLPAAAAALAPDAILLRELLAVSVTGIIFYTPLYDPADAGKIVDFTFEYLNPAAQRMMAMPEVPRVTHNQQWPHSVAHGTFQFHVEAFETGEPRDYNINYQADGYDNYYRLAARRAGTGLLVSFTDTADQPRSPVEQALRASQAREQAARAEVERQRGELQRILEQAPVAIAVFRGPTYVIELANPLVCALWGRTPAQTVGTPLFELLPETANQGFEQLLNKVMATGVPHVAHEMPAVHERAGRRETVYWNFVYLPMREDDGHVSGAMVVATEVTEQVLARQQVQELNDELEVRVAERTQTALALQADLLASAQRQAQAREAFYHIFEQTDALVQLLRAPSHRIEYVNPAYQRLFAGRSLVGRALAEALPELQQQGFVTLLDHVYQTGETYYGTDVPFVVTSPAGSPQTKYFNFTYQAYRENDQIAGISVFAYDVSDQVLARQQREAQQAQLRVLFEQAPVAIAIFEGPEYVIEVANPLVAALWGRTPAEVVGRPLFEALAEVRDQGFQELLDGVVASGEAFVAQEVAAQLQRNGQLETVYLNFVYQPLPDAQGRVTAVAAVATEVSAQVAAREQVQRLNAELQASNEELSTANQQLTRTNVDLDTFVYTASHDLKAPITNIEGILHALRDTLPPAVQQDEVVTHLLGLLDQTVNRFQLTIEQLTDLSRLQQTYNEPAQLLALAPIVAGVLADLAPAITAATAQVQLEVPADLYVSFAPASLRSIVYNLLSNAIKYRDPTRPAQVWLQAAQQAGEVVLTVRDNGLGLSESQQERLFGAFQRLHTHVAGTGVGLYMIKRLIDNAGAKIAVTSRPGGGSTFTVTFPI